MKPIGMTVVVMMVSTLRVMWRRDRPMQDGGVAEEMLGHRCFSLVACRRPGHCRRGLLAVVTDDREEDVLEGRLLLDVFDFGGREQLLQLEQRAVHDDSALAKNCDPVGEVFGLLQILRREQNGRALLGKFLDGLPHLDSRLWVEPGSRLVEKDDRRFSDEAHRDIEAAAHSTRIRRHLPIARASQ